MRRLLALALLLPALGAVGCSETPKEKHESAEKEKYFMCKNHVGKECAQQNHEEEVEGEAHEAEKVLKERRAEELANAAEGR
jgi:hypothetical protein